MNQDDENRVFKKIAAIPRIVEYLASKEAENLRELTEATLSGNNIKAIQSATLAEFFRSEIESVEDFFNETKSN